MPRPRRTKAEIEALNREIVAALEADNPQSVRHVFYLLTNPRLDAYVDKTESGNRKVGRQVQRLREVGRIPWHWIVDMSRRAHTVPTYRDPHDFINQISSIYRTDAWERSDYVVEVWCESRSIASVILDDCREWGVALYPAGGLVCDVQV